MAVVGHGGKLWLRREAPEAVVTTTAALHHPSNSLLLLSEAFWTGDEVTLTSARGLPIALHEDDPIPACPDGYGIYAGSPWALNPRTIHLLDDDSSFYTTDNNRSFYTRPEDVGKLTSAQFYIYRDQLDRVSLYRTQAAALRGRKGDRLALYQVDFGSVIVAPLGAQSYQDALLACSDKLKSATPEHETPLSAICNPTPEYDPGPAQVASKDDPSQEAASPAQPSMWTIQAALSNWDLTLTASEVNTTAVGEKFGDAVKSIVTGGGTVDFLVVREDQTADDGIPVVDSTNLMRLLLLTEKGCKADCQFWMIDNQRDVAHLLPGDLFYESSLLVTSAAVNTRAGEIIAGTINFVTVGRVALKMGTS